LTPAIRVKVNLKETRHICIELLPAKACQEALLAVNWFKLCVFPSLIKSYLSFTAVVIVKKLVCVIKAIVKISHLEYEQYN